MTWTIALIVPLILGILAKIMPYKAPHYVGNQDFALLKAQYQKWEFFSIVILFTILPAMTYAFGKLFVSMYHLFSDGDPNIVFNIVPNHLMWCLPGCILAFALIGYPLDFIYRFILRDRYEDYLIFTNLKHGFDGMRLLRPLSWILGTVAIILIILMSDYSIKIYPDKLIQNDFVGFDKKTYQFDQIKSISFIQNLKTEKGLEPNPYYLIRFNDNSFWNTNTGIKDTKKLVETVEFLARKSNKYIDTLAYVSQ
jgi:hypothetical protein